MVIRVVSCNKNLIPSETDLLIETQTSGRFSSKFSIFNIFPKNIALVLHSMIKRIDQHNKIKILLLCLKFIEIELEPL